MSSTIEFINKNMKLVKILILYFLLPNFLMNCSDLIYPDDSSWQYMLFNIALIGIIIIFGMLGFLKINEEYNFRDEGIIGRYYKSWGYVLLPMFVFTVFCFVFMIVIMIFISILSSFNLINDFSNAFIDGSLYVYFGILVILMPFMHFFFIRYIFGNFNMKEAVSGIFQIKIFRYIELVFWMALNMICIIVIYQYSMDITYLTLLLSTIFNFIYLIRLSQITKEQSELDGFIIDGVAKSYNSIEL